MRLVPLSVIKEGVFLGKTLFNDQGKILLTEGTKLTNRYIDKIKEQGFYTIYIIDDYSQQELRDVIKPQIRRQAIDTVRNIYNTFSQIEDPDINGFKKNKSLEENALNIDQIQKIAKTIVDDIFTQPELLVGLVDIKNLDSYTYNHCVNVGILALTLGIGYGLNRNDLYDLTLGCMLHDIGKIFIPKAILNKNGKLSKDEYELIQSHCEKGFTYLREHTDLSATVRIIALQHQERYDGSGYPVGLKGDNINKLAQMASVADVYDALTSDRPYRRALAPNEAIEYIMGSGGRHFNIKMVKTFLGKIIPFPIGTVVLLSNGYIGTVDKLNIEMILRPIIKVFRYDNKDIDSFICDLSQETNVVIKSVVYDL